MRYKIQILRGAQKQLRGIEHLQRNRIIEAIRALSQNPRPNGVRKLTGRDAWRCRIGRYRVIYEIFDSRLLILVVSVGHRRDIYR